VTVDALDARIIELFAAEPRIGVLECSRRLGVARGTVQARLDRMVRRGVIAGFGPEVDPAALGYGVTAFVTLQIRQSGGHDPLAVRLAAIPEVIEAHTITGTADMLVRIVGRSNQDLQRVIDMIVDVAGVERASTAISLATQIRHRTLPLVRAAAADTGAGADARTGDAGARTEAETEEDTEDDGQVGGARRPAAQAPA
jgi:DNA-binding Lrp family transcriptional regulator